MYLSFTVMSFIVPHGWDSLLYMIVAFDNWRNGIPITFPCCLKDTQRQHQTCLDINTNVDSLGPKNCSRPIGSLDFKVSTVLEPNVNPFFT